MRSASGSSLAQAIGLVAVIGAVAFAGYSAGQYAERAQWQAREAQEVAALNQRIEELQQTARDKEQQHAADIAALDAKYQERLRDREKAHAAHLAAVRSGAIRLRDPAASQSADSNRVSEAAAGAGSRDGRARGELSGATAEFLLGLAADADQVALQLQACQEIVRRDRQ